ncbi:hypothetical protein ACS5PN_00580 [Roseateles sp. NT4]|uniref:hypothetical protein n=1 Tax=Roseateles sp. NT4 TaxID=3453715 RepID=UPI003EEA2D5F
MFTPPSQIARWAFDSHASQISAVDHQGRVLMAITANPMFGVRLAAAFGWPGGYPAAIGQPLRSAGELLR